MKSDNESERQEIEANAFAMCLLMPEEFVLKEINHMGGNFDIENSKIIKKLAKKFRVSMPIMTLRIGQLSKQFRTDQK